MYKDKTGPKISVQGIWDKFITDLILLLKKKINKFYVEICYFFVYHYWKTKRHSTQHVLCIALYELLTFENGNKYYIHKKW